MTEAYEVAGVTLTPVGGGYYDLTLSGQDPERVQGKEKAEARAVAMAKAAEKPEGHIEPQGDLTASGDTLQGGAGGDIIADGDTRSPAERAQERTAGLPEPTKTPQAPDDGAPVKDPEAAAKEPEPDVVASLKDALAAAQGEIKAANARADALAKAAGPLVSTVIADEAPEPAIPGHVPRDYSGRMDKQQKAALAKIGVGVTTIVLEENESIPPTGLFISHNGRPYQIKPGEEVDVPDFLISVLDDAVMSAPIVDSGSQKVLGYRNRSKYPYRRITHKG